MSKIPYTNFGDMPVQLKFWDEKPQKWFGGIGLGNEVICGCCGRVFTIEEIYKNSSIPDPIDVYPNWIDVSEEIKGE